MLQALPTNWARLNFVSLENMYVTGMHEEK